MQEIFELRVGVIHVGDRHRELDEAACNRLVNSMREIGMRQPITIRTVELLDGEENVPVLVAGRHRLEAASRLGWTHIECLEVDDDALKVEMWEIAENLHRLDLTKDQRDEHIRRYASLLETRKEVSGQTVQQPKSPTQGGRPKEIARQIADEVGLSARTIKRALAPINNVVMVREAETDEEAIIREANAIVSAWNRARQEARELALAQIDEPVFDRTRSAHG